MTMTKEIVSIKLLEIEKKLSFLFHNLAESCKDGIVTSEQEDELDSIVLVYNQVCPLILDIADLSLGKAIKSLITKQINLFNGGINSYVTRNKIEFPDDLSTVDSLASEYSKGDYWKE